MSHMSDIHAELRRMDALIDELEARALERIQDTRAGDYFVALMNIANHPEFDDKHPLVKIARDALNLEKSYGTTI
jgi:hypothetical protein